MSRLKTTNKYKNLAINTLLFATNVFATKLVTFILVPVYTTYMSAGEYGLTDMSITVISLLTPLATLDIADAVVRYIIENNEDSCLYAATSLLITMLSVVIVGILTPLLDFGAFGGLGDYKPWFLLAYGSSALMNLFGEISRGLGKIKLVPVCAGISSVTTLFLALLLIGEMGLGLIGYFLSVSVGPCLAVLIYISIGGLGRVSLKGLQVLLRNGAQGFTQVAKPMLRYAAPLVPNSLFWWVGTSINRLFITGLLGIIASGLFAAAGKIPNLLNTVYSVFQQAWQLSAFQESGQDGISRFYSVVFRTLQAGMTVLCSLITLLSPYLAELLLKGETYGSWPMIPLLLVANLLNIFNAFYGTVYTSTMQTSYIMKTTIFGALSCVLLTPMLIYPLGTVGACVASVLGQGLVFLMRARDSRRYIKFDAKWSALIPTLIVLLAQAIVSFSQPTYWRTASFICFLAVVIMQGMQFGIIARGLFRLLLGQFQKGLE